MQETIKAKDQRAHVLSEIDEMILTPRENRPPQLVIRCPGTQIEYRIKTNDECLFTFAKRISKGFQLKVHGLSSRVPKFPCNPR
jgi:hypothetical protein